ncbi:MAG: hypothetical protein A2086_11250 [Spirochaetes bacterium GWD1_27_9]|nr:MAG: hypothetical protein A2Z98_02895 [Spirochaetes bacterium GWB1_27_13]OHD38377.1 MAG: hypothetical protein A2086_11250 [Spirochaetes bacterium GWD1_27_9]
MENNIHNDFFINIIKNKQNAIDFLSGVLPSDLLKEIDFNYLDFDDTSYIQNRFKEFFSDIVIKTKINDKNADIFVLIEHKSTLPDDKALFLQLLNYIYSMFENDYNDNKDFRLIIPLVFYHGEKEWKIHKSFLDLYDQKNNIKEYLLNFSYLLYDTKDFDENNPNQFHNNLLLISSLIALKTAFKKQDIESIIKIINNLNKLDLLNNFPRIEIFLIYILRTKDIDKKQIVEILSKCNNEGGQTMETLADYFMEKGMEKGKIEESQKTLIKQLSKKFGLTNNEIELIKKCNTLEKLDIALEDILFLDNKFDVLKKIN